MDGFLRWLGRAGSNAAHAVTGGRVGKDYDLIPNFSVRGGKRSPKNNALIGVTSTAGAPDLRGVDFNRVGTNAVAPASVAPAQEVYAGGGGGGGGVYYDPVAAARAAEAERIRAAEEAERNSILAELTGYRGRADETFNDLFSRIDQLARERRQRLNETYNEQDARYTTEFEQAIPEIDNAFAALGIGNSTYAGKRVDSATKEYEKSLQSSKRNREADLREVGEWAGSQRSALEGDKRNIFERLDRASRHNADLGELRGVRNEIGSQVNTLGGRKGAYTPGGEAMQTLERVSGRSSNFDDAMASLQGVLNSSMDTGTKDAAKTALIDNANLTDDEKRRLSEVQANNAYTRPATT